MINDKIIKACEEEPSLIFQLIKEGKTRLIDELLDKKIVSVNTIDNASNDVVTRLLKAGEYSLVLKYMKKSEWDVNHQNMDGNTFAHYLVSINYVNVMDIIKELKKNKSFTPNIRNKNNETILDKSINEEYIYTTLKILEDKRFDSIDMTSIKKLYKAYIKNPCYGKYSKVDNLNFIIKMLDKKKISYQRIQNLVDEIKSNMDLIKKDLLMNKSRRLEILIDEYV